MQTFIDIENHLLGGNNLESFIFSKGDVLIKKSEVEQKNKSLLCLESKRHEIDDFYLNCDKSTLAESQLGLFSSGTTQGSQRLILRRKLEVLEEIEELKKTLIELKSLKILIMVTPNHSFGLIPALLVSRCLSANIFLNVSQTPLEIIRHLMEVKPQVIFAVPAHIRLIADWAKKKRNKISFLKKIVYGGSLLQNELIQFYKEQEIDLLSVYGTTQTGAISVQNKVTINDVKNCGQVLRNLKVTIENTNSEIIVETPSGAKIRTGDKGHFEGKELFVDGRLDAIIFKNGSKIDLRWVESIIGNTLGLDKVEVRLEKNINGRSELICSLPKDKESLHMEIFGKIKEVLPSYAIPERYQYL